MSGFGSKPSVRSVQKGLERNQSSLNDRLYKVESSYDLVEKAVNKLIEKDYETSVQLRAVVALLGIEKVQEKVNEIQMEDARLRAEMEETILKKTVEDGFVVPVDTVSENSIIVGYETDSEGKPLGTGRQQLTFARLDAHHQGLLFGKAVGTVIPTPAGGTFEVKEIYNLDSEKARELMTKRAEEAQLQAQAAAEADEKTDSDLNIQYP